MVLSREHFFKINPEVYSPTYLYVYFLGKFYLFIYIFCLFLDFWSKLKYLSLINEISDKYSTLLKSIPDKLNSLII